MTSPPGVSDADFAIALQEFANVIGKSWVFSSDEDKALYDDSYTPFFNEPAQQLHASAAVAPSSVDQVQAIVRIANTYKVPLYATSTGRNLGYGGSAPVYSGSVIVDLKRMNRIIEVSDSAAYALVEPGVSFFDLHQYLEQNSHPLLCSPPEPGWGSPIGNALDHGVGGVAGDNYSMLAGIEAVLPDGDIVRTGMGAATTSRLWQNYRHGFGPSIDGLFCQSGLGIVTKAGFWLTRRPEMQSSFVVTSFNNDDLYPMVRAMQGLRDQGIVFTSGADSPIRSANNDTNGARSKRIREAKALLDQRDGGAASAWSRLAREKNIPAAMVKAGVRGPARMVAAAIEEARETFGKIPGITFTEGEPIHFPVDPAKVPQSQLGSLGIPNLWAFSRTAVQGTSQGHYYLSLLIRPAAEDIFEANTMIRRILLDAKDEALSDGFGWRPADGSLSKAYILIMDFLITGDVALNQRRRETFKRLLEAMGTRGWGTYRAPAAFQDLVMDQYSFNNHALRRFHETMKDAIDPNGIFAAGRSGIWPKHLRKA